MLAVEVLKNWCDLLTDIHQIKIVSSGQMFEDLCKMQASSETTNQSLPAKLFAKCKYYHKFILVQMDAWDSRLYPSFCVFALPSCNPFALEHLVFDRKLE